MTSSNQKSPNVRLSAFHAIRIMDVSLEQGTEMDTRINETLARLRSKSGLTQEEAANHLGITKAAVSKWECGGSLR